MAFSWREKTESEVCPAMAPTFPGDFDVYLLAQTWSPHFCCTNSDRCTTVPWAFSAKHLSLHGLWPGFAMPRSGDPFPSNCKSKVKLMQESLPREYIDVAPSFTTWNPKEHRAEVGGLAKHEWSKVCDQDFHSGLSPWWPCRSWLSAH